MEQDLQQLVQIYNTMLLISTSGNDTLYMADCLRALKNYIMEHDNSNRVTEEE